MEIDKCIWIARDQGIWDHPNFDCKVGALRMYYDTPERTYKDGLGIWSLARVICDVPSYMYPEITWENSPIKFIPEK